MIKTARAERPVRRRLPHEIPSWVPDGEIYFLTICARERGSNVLLDHAAGWIESAVFYHGSGSWHLHLIVIIPDHLHLLVSFPVASGLQKFHCETVGFSLANRLLRKPLTSR